MLNLAHSQNKEYKNVIEKQNPPPGRFLDY